MIEIIFDNAWIKDNLKLFQYDDNVEIFPKSPTMFKFWKYFKDYRNVVTNISFNEYITKMNSFPEKYITSNNFYKGIAIFEFPDEETAFYFKLKFP